MADQKKENVESYGERTICLAEANNHLALNLYKLLAEEQKNVFFSPFSVSTAFAMLFHGAKTDTQAEMRHVLGYDVADVSNDDLINSYKYLIETLILEPKSYTLAVANSLIYQKDFAVKERYENDVKEIFNALVKKVDFLHEKEAALEEINNYVSENTNKMIPKLLDEIDSQTVFILINAVYFKGTWLHQFKTQATKPQLFYNKGLDSNAKEIPMMYIKESFQFIAKENYKSLELPYQGDIAILLLLPHSKIGLSDLESKILKDNFMKDLQNGMHKTKVRVFLPKFRMEYCKSLKKTFQGIGMKTVFNQSADFGDITESSGVEVSDVVHKAVLEINEEGSEAAAATAIICVTRCAMVSIPEPEFVADHPFMFLIYDKRNNIILFAGRVEEL